jgi:hypothetical protein
MAELGELLDAESLVKLATRLVPAPQAPPEI